MPTISVFFGIIISMYFKDHNPPHFHAEYGEYEATIDIRTLAILEGRLPRRGLALVLEWASEHRAELLDNWQLCREKRHPNPIEPLE